MQKRDNRGISIMIGYILLIVIAIFISIAIFLWVKTYALNPDSLELQRCSESVSLYLDNVECHIGENLTVTLKNNGLFSAAGYFIHVSDDINQEIADKDLSQNISEGGYRFNDPKSIRFGLGANNSLAPGTSQTHTFNIGGNVSLVEIIPTRYEEINNRLKLGSCGGAKISERILCVNETEIPYSGHFQDCDDFNVTEEFCAGANASISFLSDNFYINPCGSTPRWNDSKIKDLPPPGIPDKEYYTFAKVGRDGGTQNDEHANLTINGVPGERELCDEAGSPTGNYTMYVGNFSFYPTDNIIDSPLGLTPQLAAINLIA